MSRVVYVWSPDLQAAADELPSNLGRSSMVHDLIRALDLVDDGTASTREVNEVAGDGTRGHHGKAEDGDDGEDGDEGVDRLRSRSRSRPQALARARIVPPDLDLGSVEQLKTYHDAKYVDYLMNPSTHTDAEDGRDSSDSEVSSSIEEGESDDSYHAHKRPKKRRRTEHGLEHDCPSFPALPTYARLVAAATATACREILEGRADVAICWDGGRHHTMRNRASGFCYVADVVLGIMALAKGGRAVVREPRAQDVGEDGSSALARDLELERPADSPPAREDMDQSIIERNTTEDSLDPPPPKPLRRARVMYIDLDIHEGDGVHQAFLSPSRYPPSKGTKKPPKPPQVLTLSIHHHSRTFFPPHRPFSGLPNPETPHPFTLSIPLHAYAGAGTYARIWSSVEAVRESFDPDYIVLQLGLDGFPGDRVGQYGAWGIDGTGGLRWCVGRVMGWGLPMCVLGGGGYDHANAARGWAVATSELLGRGLDADTHVPDHDHLPAYAPSFTLEVPQSHARDENDDAHIETINETFSHIGKRIEGVMKAHQG